MGLGGQCHALATVLLERTQYPSYRRLSGPHGQCGWVRKDEFYFTFTYTERCTPLFNITTTSTEAYVPVGHWCTSQWNLCQPSREWSQLTNPTAKGFFERSIKLKFKGTRPHVGAAATHWTEWEEFFEERNQDGPALASSLSSSMTLWHTAQPRWPSSGSHSVDGKCLRILHTESRPITGIRSLDHSAHNKSLYWLSCPSVCVCVLTKFVYKVRAVSQWQFVPYFQNMLLILTLSSRFTDDSSSYWFKTCHIFINKAIDYVKCFLFKKKPCADVHDDMQRPVRLAYIKPQNMRENTCNFFHM